MYVHHVFAWCSCFDDVVHRLSYYGGGHYDSVVGADTSTHYLTFVHCTVFAWLYKYVF